MRPGPGGDPLRDRSAIILVEKGQLALIRRVKAGETYYLFPGGGVDPGESLEEAAAREALEELGITVSVGPQVAQVLFRGNCQSFFLANHVSGQFGTGEGEEMGSLPQSPWGSYEPVWMPLQELWAHDVRPKRLALWLTGAPDPTSKECLVFQDEGPRQEPMGPSGE